MHEKTEAISGKKLKIVPVASGIAALILIFSILTVAIAHGKTLPFDEWVLRSLRDPQNSKDALGPQWFERGMKDLTVLGGRTTLAVLGVVFGGYLVLRRDFGRLALMLVIIGGAMTLDKGFKLFFLRARPSIVPHLDFVSSYSFPSGHALLSMSIYTGIGILAAQRTTDRTLRIYIVGMAMAIGFGVGLTRIYLGVHYPTDVIAGWSIGLVWTLTCCAVASAIRKALFRR